MPTWLFRRDSGPGLKCSACRNCDHLRLNRQFADVEDPRLVKQVVCAGPPGRGIIGRFAGRLGPGAGAVEHARDIRLAAQFLRRVQMGFGGHAKTDDGKRRRRPARR